MIYNVVFVDDIRSSSFSIQEVYDFDTDGRGVAP